MQRRHLFSSLILFLELPKWCIVIAGCSGSWLVSIHCWLLHYVYTYIRCGYSMYCRNRDLNIFRIFRVSEDMYITLSRCCEAKIVSRAQPSVLEIISESVFGILAIYWRDAISEDLFLLYLLWGIISIYSTYFPAASLWISRIRSTRSCCVGSPGCCPSSWPISMWWARSSGSWTMTSCTSIYSA